MIEQTPTACEGDLRASVRDGVAFSVMVGLGETYLSAFALALGHGEVAAGLLATLPMLAGAAFQLGTPLGVRWLRSYRRWVVLCAACQALAFAPLVSGALLGDLSLAWIFVAAAAYWGFGMATSPAWNAWMGELVPPERWAAFFAHRNRMSQGALFLAVVLAGLLLHRSHAAAEPPVLVFGGLFASAGCARLLSAGFLSRQSEPPGLADSLRTLSGPELQARFRHGPGARILVYLLSMQLAVHLAAPLFTPFLLERLDFSYGEFMAVTAAAFLARVVVLPGLGRLAAARGTGPLLWLGALGIAPLPVLWLALDSFTGLLALQAFAGAAWAAVELATVLAFFEQLEQRERTSVLAVFNLVNTVAMALGAVLGGLLFLRFGGYAAVFALSALARFATLPLLRGVGTVEPPVSVGPLRTLAVRPNSGAIQRPVLPGAPDPTGPDPG